MPDTIETVENKTFDEITIGDRASLSRTLTRDDIDLFAVVTGDVNPSHVDEAFAGAAGPVASVLGALDGLLAGQERRVSLEPFDDGLGHEGTVEGIAVVVRQEPRVTGGNLVERQRLEPGGLEADDQGLAPAAAIVGILDQHRRLLVGRCPQALVQEILQWLAI